MKRVAVALVCAACLPVLASARGNRYLVQVADGPGIRTVVEFANRGGFDVTNHRLEWRRQDGSAWNLETDRGTSATLTLSLEPGEVSRIQTLGRSSSVISGYAVLIDNEGQNSTFSKDYNVEVTSFYEVYSGGNLISAVSVPAAKTTASFAVPVEIDKSRGIYTGIALVNPFTAATQVQLNLTETTGPGTVAPAPLQADVTLQPGQQIAEFLAQRLFPGADRERFRGLLEGWVTAESVAALALRQFNTSLGVQYVSIVPTSTEDLKRNSDMLLRAAFLADEQKFTPVDFDVQKVDYLKEEREDEAYGWDIRYNVVNSTTRNISADYARGIAPLGVLDSDRFDALTLPELKNNYTYTKNSIDLSDNSPQLAVGFSFAILTDLRNYAKARISRIYTLTDAQGNKYVDLGLEVYTYR